MTGKVLNRAPALNLQRPQPGKRAADSANCYAKNKGLRLICQWCICGALFDTLFHKATLINTVHRRSEFAQVCASKCLFV